MISYTDYMRNKAQAMLDQGWTHETGIECSGTYQPDDAVGLLHHCNVELRSRLEDIQDAFGKREQAVCPRCLGVFEI